MKRSSHGDHEIAFVVVVQNEHPIAIAARINADYDVTCRTLELARALPDDDLRCLPQIGREYQAPRGRLAAIHDALENIGRGMARRPTGHDEHGRCQRAQKLFALFAHGAMLVHHMYVDSPDHGSDRRFERSPELESDPI